MRWGTSVGPNIAAIDDVSDRFDVIECAIGEHETPVAEIDPAQVRSMAGDRGLVVHLPFRQPVATTVDVFNDAVLEYFEQLLAFSVDELGAEKAVIHANMRDQDAADELAVLEDQIQALQDRNRGVELCFENVWHVDTPDLSTLGMILDDTGASMCLDVGHAYMEADEHEIVAFIEEYGDLISHLHLHDVRDRGDSHIAIGEGDIDYASVMGALAGFDGTACLEIFTEDRVYQERSLDRLQELV